MAWINALNQGLMAWLWHRCERMSRPQCWALVMVSCSAFWLGVLLCWLMA